jgi:ubiquinone/menaquinone biosynthesis C-methylase UbiE
VCITLRATNLTRYSYHSAMTSFDFLAFNADFTSPRIVNAYDELPLWSAMFGLLLLEEVPLANIRKALDAGCGTGFPLIELAERLGPASEVHGIDPWTAGLERARQKLEARATPNVTLHEGSATSMPFDDATFDLIVSNLGVNNFDDRNGAMRECRRVARKGATLALTTNLQGHMREFYDALAQVIGDRSRLDAHVAHRATIPAVRQLLEENGFAVQRVVEREGVMRFANATALFNHHFIKLGFLDAWKEVAGDDAREVFGKLMERMSGEIRLTIPMAYVEAMAI